MAALLRRPEWQQLAACRGEDPDLFFPGPGLDPYDTPRVICAGCPVRLDCLEYALDHHVDEGCWGGTTPRQRERARREGTPAVVLLADVVDKFRGETT